MISIEKKAVPGNRVKCLDELPGVKYGQIGTITEVLLGVRVTVRFEHHLTMERAIISGETVYDFAWSGLDDLELVCQECDGEADERVEAGMKCGRCAYGG